MAIAIIPARGGSKRIPHKNIRPFHGRPMIGWSIAAAKASGLFSQIVVSTDDATIARIARDEGAETPFTRSAELADDHTGTSEVIADALQRLETEPLEEVCCIYATAPFVTPESLREGLDTLRGALEGFVFPVTEFPAPIARGYFRSPRGIAPISKKDMERRSQDLEPAFYDAGQFYWAHAGTWLSGDKVWDNARAVFLPPSRVCDIDTEDDWERAEHLFSWLNRS